MSVESYREVIMYLRPEEEAKVKLAPNEEVVDQRLATIGGEWRWTFIIKRTTAK
jgi:hypothetical protein